MMNRNLSKLLLAGSCALTLSVPALASTFTVLHTFKGRDGMTPRSALTLDPQGNLYGTTSSGGSSKCGDSLGCGTVFRLAPDGTQTILHEFKGGKDGAYPWSGLSIGPDGALYGTTREGGDGKNCDSSGCGTVYRITVNGAESVFYAFQGGDTDGWRPETGVAVVKNGTIYATTSEYADTFGALYKILPDGAEIVLHAFDGFPVAKPVLDKEGNLYGTTFMDGAGYGTVFKVTPDGTKSLLHTFSGGSDGSYPRTDLLLDKIGNLYGTAQQGGDHDQGVVFRLAPDGAETVLYTFGAFAGDGGYPFAGVVADRKGNLFGTTSSGGSNNMGTVFKLKSDGEETVLYSFAGSKDGAKPFAALVADKAGNLYGTTYAGGSTKGVCAPDGCGTVFRVTP